MGEGDTAEGMSFRAQPGSERSGACVDAGPFKAFKEVYYESKAVREAHVREVQDHQAQGQGHGNL